MITGWLVEGGYAALLRIHLGLLLGIGAWVGVGALKSLGRSGRVALIAVAALTWGLLWSRPFTPHVFFDEFYYTATASHLALDGRAEPLIWEGIPPRPRRTGRFLPPYPQGWPFVLSLGLDATVGPPAPGRLEPAAWEGAARVARHVAGLAPLACFLALRRSAPVWAAAFGALALATLPPVLKLSGTAAAGNGSLAALALAGWALAELHHRPGLWTLAFFALAIPLPGQLRPESLAYVGLFLLAAWPVLRGFPLRIQGLALAAVAWLCLPALVAMGSGRMDPELAHHFQATPRAGFTPWENRAANLLHNLLFLVQGRSWPQAMTSLAILGGLFGWGAGRGREVAWALLWGVGVTLGLSWFPFGDYLSVHSYDTWRFAHHVALPGVWLAVLGVVGLASRGLWGRGLAAALALGCLAAPWLQRPFLEEAHPLEGLRQAVSRLRGEAVSGWVAAEDPEIFCLLRYGAGLPAVLGPLRVAPEEGLWVFAVEGAEGLPRLSMWRGMDLEPWWLAPAGSGQVGLFRVSPPAAPAARPGRS